MSSKVTTRNSQEVINHHEQLVKLVNDYSVYCKIDISLPISRLLEYVEEASAKLDEFESLLEMNKSETAEWMSLILPNLVGLATNLEKDLSSKLNTFEKLVQHSKSRISQLEIEVSEAEQFVRSSSSPSSFRSIFNFFKKSESQEAVLTHSTTLEALERLEGMKTLNLENYFSETN